MVKDVNDRQESRQNLPRSLFRTRPGDQFHGRRQTVAKKPGSWYSPDLRLKTDYNNLQSPIYSPHN